MMTKPLDPYLKNLNFKKVSVMIGWLQWNRVSKKCLIWYTVVIHGSYI